MMATKFSARDTIQNLEEEQDARTSQIMISYGRQPTN